MANRYWRGGAGTWDTTTTTNWSATSGGAGGASVPTTADSVFFDQAGTYTVTCTGALNCLDLTVSAGTVTFANGTTPTWTIAGSVSLIAGTVWSATGTKTFTATTAKTITTNGVTFTGGCTFNGVGGSWTLGSALNISSSSIIVTNGTFDTSSTGNYSVTAGELSSSNSNTRTINLNASTITINFIGITFTTSTNLTLNAGTSQINVSTSGTFAGGGKTFYNVSFTSTASSTQTITGANTFNNLSITGRTSVGFGSVVFSANQTINGTLTLSTGTASAYRIMIASDTIGTQRTLTCAAISSVTDYDFRDINFAGAISLPVTGTRLGDCKGNGNITFPAAKTVYYRQTGSANWGATGTGSWSATSGGAADATMFPLAQDTAVFPAATYPASGSTTTINANYNIGTIDMSLRTSNTMTLATSAVTATVYGNWINGTGITNTASAGSAFIFAGRTTQQITSNGVSCARGLTVNSPSGTVQLQDAFSCGTAVTTTLTTGTIDLQSYTLSTGIFDSSGTSTRTIAFGTGNITCTGTGSVWTSAVGLTTTGTQVVNIISVGSTAITVSPGVLSEANSISFNFTGGTYALTLFLFANHTARSLDFTGYSGTLGAMSTPTIYGNLKLSTGMTLTTSASTLTFGATSGTQQITTNGKTLDFPITFNGVGGTFQLQDALTTGTTRTTTLTQGTLNLQSYTLSTGLFSSSNSNTRTIAFGTGNITCTGTGTVWTTSTVTGLTTTGTQVVNVTSAGSTAITVTAGSLSEANSISYNFTGGTYLLSFVGNSAHTARSANFTGFAGTLNNSVYGTFYGNIIFSSGMTLLSTANGPTFGATSGTQQITTNGKTLDFPLTFNGVGGTFQLQDALTMGSTRTATLTNGTLDLNGNTMTVGTRFTITTGTKNLTFNGGTLVCPDPNTTSFNNTAPTGFTTTAGTGTGTISMTAATAKTFVGGGSTFNCTLNQGGAGALTITGSNTFADITNTVQPASVLFTAGTTTTFTSGFSLSGTAGNLITIGSVTAASHTLSKASGTVSSDYLSISRSTATGGASWYAGANSTNGGNNSGWIFTAPPSGYTAGGQFMAFF